MTKPYKYAVYLIGFFSILTIFSLVALRAPEWHKNYIIGSVGNSVVTLTAMETRGHGGTGFVVEGYSGEKYTLTNAHICRIAYNNQLRAYVDSTDRYSIVRVIEISHEFDLCILTPVAGVKPLSLASSLTINQDIGVIGHPHLEYKTLQRGYLTNFEVIDLIMGFNWENSQCASEGGEYQEFDRNSLFALIMGVKSMCTKKYMSGRTNVIIYPGNSGSPAVNFWGEVVGVVFAADTKTNQGFIVPLNSVKVFMLGY